MNKQFINQHDMSAQQKRFYARIAGAQHQYQQLRSQGSLPVVNDRKTGCRPRLAIAASVIALAAALLVNPLDNQVTVSEVAALEHDVPESPPAMGSIIPRMNRASTSLFADRPRLSAKRRPSFRAPPRPLKDSA